MTKKTNLSSIGNQTINVLRETAVRKLFYDIKPSKTPKPRMRLGGFRGGGKSVSRGRVGGFEMGGQIQPVINQGGSVNIYLGNNPARNIFPQNGNPFSEYSGEAEPPLSKREPHNIQQMNIPLRAPVSTGDKILEGAKSFAKIASVYGLANVMSRGVAGQSQGFINDFLSGVSPAGFSTLAGLAVDTAFSLGGAGIAGLGAVASAFAPTPNEAVRQRWAGDNRSFSTRVGEKFGSLKTKISSKIGNFGFQSPYVGGVDFGTETEPRTRDVGTMRGETFTARSQDGTFTNLQEDPIYTNYFVPEPVDVAQLQGAGAGGDIQPEMTSVGIQTTGKPAGRPPGSLNRPKRE